MRHRIEGVVRILVVCSGNICRSPMGEGILRALAARHLDPDAVAVASAGTLGLVGHAPHPHAIAACARRGVDISAQRSRALDVDALRWATHVACMDAGHLAFVRKHLPRRADDAFLLAGADVEDPLGADLAAFEATRDVVWDACERLLERAR
jgi:protein-tyrosine phosphatase